MSTEHVSPGSADIPLDAMGRSDASGLYRDLCSNCNHAEACGGRSSPRRPIFFCEEFDVFVPVPISPPVRSLPTQPNKRQSTNEHTGLCMNCDNAETCTLPKPEGGIWHCEEYR